MPKEVESKPPGQIITFYSYKGGTGRSMAMANVAYVLANNDLYKGKRVLIIDWDLEAPGLYRYFEHDFGKQSNCLADIEGLLEFVEAAERVYRKEAPLEGLPENRADSDEAGKIFEHIRRTFDLERTFIEVGSSNLTLLKAGKEDEEYANRVRSFNWEGFYAFYGSFFTHFRRYLSEKFDFVLIDSRTGLTDTGGICTRVMPEKLVGVFAPNHQNIEGLKKVIQGAYDHRRKSRDPRNLMIFPLASRIDSAASKLRKTWWKGGIVAGQEVAGYERIFEELFIDLFDLDECDLHEYFDSTQIPHDSDYAYGEEIAARYDYGVSDKLSIGTACANLTERLVTLEAPWERLEEDAKLAAAQNQASQAKLALEVATVEQLRTRIFLAGALILITLVLTAVWLNYRKDKSVAQYNVAGLQAMEAGNYSLAIQNFSQAIEVRPDRADAYKYRADAYWRNLQNYQAIADYTKAIQLKPDSSDLYLLRGSIYGSEREYDLAIADYNKVLKISPNNISVYLELGNLHSDKKSYFDAISDYTRAIDSGDAAIEGAAYLRRGMAYRETGDQERAIRDFLKASAIPIERSDRRYAQAVLESLNYPKLRRDIDPNTFRIFLAYADRRDGSTVDEIAHGLRTAGYDVRVDYDLSSDRSPSVAYYSDSIRAREEAEYVAAQVIKLVAEKASTSVKLIPTHLGDVYAYVPSENIEVYLPSLQKPVLPAPR